MRDKVIFPVFPQCCFFTVRPDDQSDCGCGDRGFVQCGARGTLALLDEGDLVCGEYCPAHGEVVLDALLEPPESAGWHLVPIVRGNPITGVVDAADRPS